MIAKRVSAEIIDHAEIIVRSGWSERAVIKGGRYPVTDVDLAVERFARQRAHELTPQWGFLGEEFGHTGSKDEYWCLDPIDGTVNFSRKVPHFSVSLGLIRGGQPVQGEVLLPGHQERFFADHTSASAKSTSSVTTLNDVVVGVGDFSNGPGVAELQRKQVLWVQALAATVMRVRMQGSAAIDLCWLAAGRLDGVVVTSNKPWDMAAGVAIARAAGAIVTHTDGSPYSIDGPDILAAAPGVHQQLVELLASA